MNEINRDAEQLKKIIESSILTGIESDITDAVLNFDLLFVLGIAFNDSEVNWVLDKISHVMEDDSIGSNPLVNLFQSHWSKLSEQSQEKVIHICEKYVSDSRSLGTQVAMHEIIRGEYLD